MRFWTVHVRPGDAPVLVREGFAWGALLFGPIWLAAHRAWVPAALSLAAAVLIVVLAPPEDAAILLLGMTVWLGLSGRDLCRWSATHRRFVLSQVVVARDDEQALDRLLARRPDLAGSFLPPAAAR